MTNNIILSLIFLGSVFLISGKFVNATNTPKFYFVAVSLLVTIAITAIHKKKITFGVLSGKTIFWGINIVCFAQALYGILQFVGWLPSHHSKFAITGSFDNPAGFTAVLAMGFPISLFLLAKAKKIEKYLTTVSLMVIAIAIFLSGSRAGMLAILVASVFFVLSDTNVMSKFQQFRYHKLLAVLIVVCFVASTVVLYHQKKDSANGRILIWKVSSEMIKDRPVFGHGYGAFLAKYMDYQAEYFKSNPDSKFELLADNVKHPFNEFIKVAVEFGIAGFVLILSFIFLILWRIIESKNENRELVLSGLASSLALACFSYPLQYVATWLLIAFYLSAVLPSKEIRIRYTPILIISRIVLVAACIFALSHMIRQVGAERKWKAIAMSSLRGNTEKMLPEYRKLHLTPLKRNPFFLYNYGAELNVAGQYEESIAILSECQEQFNDYDLQMLLADNYYHIGDTTKAIQTYKYAENMIPCRFLPVYHLFEIYKKGGQKDMATRYANEIINKIVKIPSITVNSIKSDVKEYLNENT